MGVRCFLFFFFLLLRDEHPQNVPSGRRGEEKWLYSHGKTHSDSLIIGDLTHIMPFRGDSKWLWQHSSTFTFGGVLKKIGKPGEIHWPILWSFFSCTSQVEIAISRCFQDRILRRVTRTSGPCCSADKSVLFCLRHVKWYYHANQIIIYSTRWYKCLMVTVFHG